MPDITDLNLSQDELRFAEQYARMLDYASRIVDAVQAANGDWRYISEKLGALQGAAARLNDIISAEVVDEEFPGEPHRETREEFKQPPGYAGRDHFAGGPTKPVPAGIVDPGKIRAAAAVLGWHDSIPSELHPLEGIEDRFAGVRERVRSEKSAYWAARTEEAIGLRNAKLAEDQVQAADER